MKQTQPTTPERLTTPEALKRAKAADHIARGIGWGAHASEWQRLKARSLSGAYQHTAAVLAEVDSE